ncbi:hypothetical protein Rumeso_04509 [Rubellimicrobium mesophilum DSM 19309]|uniref:Uncharacterized protein n=1 Tax=Rubellimicrobium mesophilum DSM 19309 TaxID=442562 RepID=A0A017HHD0_9RHOB|nr:hypothetical protein [Rubellimicrobium mesophilum]EYD73912.1 hypothetical protein Rumeso_04509 [Rubellimicrobium mesophilum DSM 19309]
MDDIALLLVAALGLGILGWQARRLSRASAARRAARAGFLDACATLLSDTRKRVEPDGFPRLAGASGGARFDLRVVPDTLTTRKLPALWLLVTLTEPLPLPATWHLMLRPRGTETFSAFDRLPHILPPQPGLPEDSQIRTDSGGTPPPVLAEIVARLGEDRLKEVVLSPKGLRITWLAEEANRGRYLIFRDAEMGLEPLPPDTLAPLLDALLDLRAGLQPERRRA